jgi:hypothetical protein
VRIVVTELTGQGSIRRGVLDTDGRSDADHSAGLIERAALDRPPPYRPVPGGRVYHVHADDKIVLVAERELTGPLRELVMTTLAGKQRGAPHGHRGPAPRERPGQRLR